MQKGKCRRSPACRADTLGEMSCIRSSVGRAARACLQNSAGRNRKRTEPSTRRTSGGMAHRAGRSTAQRINARWQICRGSPKRVIDTSPDKRSGANRTALLPGRDQDKSCSQATGEENCVWRSVAVPAPRWGKPRLNALARSTELSGGAWKLRRAPPRRALNWAS